MIKIGDFSKLTHVTVKALRHYARLGLLRPAWTDRFTGYRYYTLSQIPRLNRILALKELGFSLDQIKPMLDSELPIEQLRALLRQKQAELMEHLQTEQQRLHQVEARLQGIEHSAGGLDQPIAVKHIPAQTVAALRGRISLRSAAKACDQMRSELKSWLAFSGISRTGPWLVLHHDREYSELAMDLELAVVLEAPLPANRKRSAGTITVRCLPEVPVMASLVHTGPIESLQQCYTALYAWIEANGYRINGPWREVTLADTSAEGAASELLEVQMPVERRDLRPTTWNSSNKTGNEDEMEPKFVNLPAFMVVGIPYVGRNQNHEISQTWDVFDTRAPAIKNASNEGAYGICSWVEGAEEGVFEYVCGFKVSKVDDLPEGMVARMVPASRYAIFAHRGLLDTLSKTYEYIYQTWLPQSGYELTGGPDFEFYNEEFDITSPNSVFYIYVPIK